MRLGQRSLSSHSVESKTRDLSLESKTRRSVGTAGHGGSRRVRAGQGGSRVRARSELGGEARRRRQRWLLALRSTERQDHEDRGRARL